MHSSIDCPNRESRLRQACRSGVHLWKSGAAGASESPVAEGRNGQSYKRLREMVVDGFDNGFSHNIWAITEDVSRCCAEIYQNSILLGYITTIRTRAYGGFGTYVGLGPRFSNKLQNFFHEHLMFNSRSCEV